MIEPKLCCVCTAVLVGRQRKYCDNPACQRERKKRTKAAYNARVGWDNAGYCREWRARQKGAG